MNRDKDTSADMDVEDGSKQDGSKTDVTMQTSMSTSSTSTTFSTSTTSLSFSTFISSLSPSTLSSSSSSSSSSSTSTVISSSLSFSSGSQPPTIFLATYVKALNDNGFSRIFTSAEYDEAAFSLVNGDLPAIYKELHIQKVGRVIGRTISVEGGRIRYCTACDVQVASMPLTLIVNKRPSNKIRYRLPSTGPLVGHGPKIAASTKEHGFKALDEPAIISPVWSGPRTFPTTPSFTVKTDVEGLLYSYQYGIPLVDKYPLTGDDHVQIAFSWQLTQYCAYDPKNPDYVGDERFIFTGHTKKHSLSGYYIRLVDLKKRLELGNEDVATDDLLILDDGKAPYPLWKPDGELLTGSDLNLRFGSIAPRALKSSSKSFISEMRLFLAHCQLVQFARLSEGLYDVLSRFWDKAWEANCIFELNPKWVSKIMESAKRRKTTPSFTPTDGEKCLIDLIKEVMEDLSFAPKFALVNTSPDTSKYKEWARHPGNLYVLWMDSVAFSQVGKVGLWLPSRPKPDPKLLKGPDDEIQSELSTGSTYKTGEQAKTTNTIVTSFSVDHAKNFKRVPDQIGAMGKKSPNKLVKSWWDLDDGEKAAEWLHRSAWSYGGLFNDGKIDPLSSQVMSNLIIGTHETNTMMMRYEIFIKRYAYYTKNPVRVETIILTDKDTTPTYAWYCDKLHYAAQDDKTKEKLIERPFNPFERRLPTRLELSLDELFESLAWRWEDPAFQL